MKLRQLLLNKYSISVLILLLLLGTDMLLHKGMTRVMISSNFNEYAISSIEPCEHTITVSGKEWIKGVNTLEQMQALADAPGMETDVYFDKEKMEFFVYHDSSKISSLTLDSLLSLNHKVNSIWLDFKNLDDSNNISALQKLKEVRQQFNKKILVESPNAKALQIFCANDFPTIYYTPFFNPYTDTESQTRAFSDSISRYLKSYPASAMSGYYFQYPILKHNFPAYPVLTWSEKHSASAVSYFLNRQMMRDTSVKIILYSQE